MSQTPRAANPEIPQNVASLVFCGTGSPRDCEDFIGAVRLAAYLQDPDASKDRMLKLAVACLRGPAVSWHARLVSETKENWDLFVEALLQRYVDGQPETSSISYVCLKNCVESTDENVIDTSNASAVPYSAPFWNQPDDGKPLS